ncbi:MAG: hypothetical protein ACYSTL_00450, partial [Planctomycetota bacterium]
MPAALGCACAFCAIIVICPVLLADTPTTIPAAETFEEAFELTRKEAAVLESVSDRVAQLDEAAFYVFLRKAARLAAIETQFDRLDRPTAANLLEHPQRYRAWPILINVQVSRMEKLAVGDGLSASGDWPPDRPVWKIGCFSTEGAGGRIPLLIFSVVEPTLLGDPDKIGPAGDNVYIRWRDAQICALFYKVATYEGADGRTREYPVAIAWSLSEPDAAR